jgi:DNA-binding response OmpR family regulator
MKHALVVDDDAAFAGLVAAWLEAAGYAVETAVDFATAKRRVSGPKDVLIVDVRLEEYNGLQLAIQARSIDATIRIIVMSGWDDPVLRAQATAIGADFLLKPFDAEQLLRAVGD